MLPAAALALERLLVRRRVLATALVYADAFERWGPREGPEFERMIAETAAAQREHAEVTTELGNLARDTWDRDRECVIAWANAHVELLDHVVSASDDDARRAAALHIDEWRKVARGELGYVDESSDHIELDAARHAELFDAPGLVPPTSLTGHQCLRAEASEPRAGHAGGFRRDRWEVVVRRAQP
jgi:hypothetical protein